MHPLDTPKREPANALLMVSPEHFSVEYAINVHMEGQVGTVDQDTAKSQWETLKDTFERIGYQVPVIAGVEGLPDHVFTANTAIMHKRDDNVHVVLSRMANPQRLAEVDVIADWCRQRGYTIHELPDDPAYVLEGMGDVVWHPERELLYGGHGFRSTLPALERMGELLSVAVVPLQLVDDRYYHLDVALAPLNEHTAVIVPGAFTPESEQAIRDRFEHVIELSEPEAMAFGANGFAPDGKHFIVHSALHDRTKQAIEQAGLQVIELDTSEYIKAGGSVYCMELEVFV
jgi:N-dimethylarginine dimethylaminohydrolase